MPRRKHWGAKQRQHAKGRKRPRAWHHGRREDRLWQGALKRVASRYDEPITVEPR